MRVADDLFGVCEVCGGTDADGCYWVDIGLCSRCAEEIDKRQQRGMAAALFVGVLVALAVGAASEALYQASFWLGVLIGCVGGFALVVAFEQP